MDILTEEAPLPPAGPAPFQSAVWRRTIAFAIDVGILAFIGRTLGAGFSETATSLGPLGRLLGFLVAVAYFGVAHGFRGQSIGKKLAGLRLVMLTGDQLSWPRAFLRGGILCSPYFIVGAWLPHGHTSHVASVGSVALLLFGAYFYLFNSPAHRTFHDFVCGTTVVRVDQETPFIVPEIWLWHRVIAISLTAVYIFANLVLMRVAPMMFPAMYSLTSGLADQPNVVGAQVGLFPYKVPGRAEPAKMARVTVLLKKLTVTEDNMSRGIANAAMGLYPDLRGEDVLMIIVHHGYDLGLWSRYHTIFAAHTINEWNSGLGFPDPEQNVSYTGVGVMVSEEHPFVIEEVFPRSAAARTGLLPGDFIVAIDGRKPKDNDEAMEWLRGESGTKVRLEITRNSSASPMIFDIVRGTVENNWKDKADAFRTKAEKGDHLAELNLGECYLRGIGVPQSYPAALEWFNKAAEGGQPDGWRHIGEMHIDGYGVEKSGVLALKYFRLAADKGNALAMAHIGQMYSHGAGGLPHDPGAAYEWYSRAAAAGDMTAQYNTASMLERGEGTAMNMYEAVRWFKKSAEQGFPEAQRSYGEHLQTGTGVETNAIEGEKWLRKAAESGHALAQMRLGQTYRNGWGVEPDRHEAHKWFTLSAAQGNETAAQELKEMAQP